MNAFEARGRILKVRERVETMISHLDCAADDVDVTWPKLDEGALEALESVIKAASTAIEVLGPILDDQAKRGLLAKEDGGA